MDTTTKRFWDIAPCSKMDELHEKRHIKLITACMQDSETGCECFEPGSFILYGKEEALLFRPKTVLFRVCMHLFEAMCSILPKE